MHKVKKSIENVPTHQEIWAFTDMVRCTDIEMYKRVRKCNRDVQGSGRILQKV